MTYVVSALGFIIVMIVISRLVVRRQFNREVVQLFSRADISERTFSYEQLAGLPEPVARYFRHVLKQGQPYVSTVRLLHDGLFKTGLKKKWINIKGEQYFTASPSGFVWKGTTTLFTARDMYINDMGRLVVLLLSLIKVVDAKGESYNEAELQRWLAECVWFPTNLLPGEHVSWEAIDANTAKLNFKYKAMTLFYRASFNETGEITQLETTRFMSKEKKETWIGTLWDYKECNSVIIPTTIEVKWVVGNEHYPYARFHVKTIEYNKLQMF